MSSLELYPYQELAVEHLQANKHASLFLDMGMGKSAITLRSLEPRHLPVLVVAPKRVAEEVWPTEVGIWRPDLSIEVAANGPKGRRAALDSDADIVAIGRDNLKDLTAKDARKFSTVVLDELSSFKNSKSIRFKAMRRFIREGNPTVWGLTGTPTPNGLMDLWSQIFLLDQGERLGSGITHFRTRYFSPGRQLASGVITEWILRPGADTRIQEKIADICLSMQTNGRIKLPPVTENWVDVPLDAKTRKVYDTFKKDLIADISLISDDPVKVFTAQNAAVLSNKLCQITAGFLYPDEGGEPVRFNQNKIKVAEEIVEAALGSPVLIFYRFREELRALKEAFPQASTVDEKGFQAKWNDGKIPVLLAHPDSAGHGLNLQHGGHTIVWTSPTWSMEGNEQANKRLARNGQKNPVVIHYLLSPDTVDYAVMRVLAEKVSVQSALMDYLEFY